MDDCAIRRRQLSQAFKRCQGIFLALGDETRQQIFITLLENEKIGMRVPDVTAKTHLSRPAVSHHLRVLKDAGLIGMHRAGTMNYYYANADSGCLSGLKALADHVNEVAASARKNGYPRLKEDEKP